MTFDKASKIAIDAIREKQRKIAFEANLAKQGIHSIYNDRVKKQYNELEEAIHILEEHSKAIKSHQTTMF